MPSAATAIVDRLERAGCAERVPSSADRRKTLVQARPLDDTAETRAFRRMGETTARFMHQLTGAQRAAVVDYMALTTRLVTEETRRLRELSGDQDTRHADA